MADFVADLEAERDAISALTRRAAAFLAGSGVDARAVHHTALVLDELLTNVAAYGGAGAGVLVRLTTLPDRVTAQVVDGGAMFDPRVERQLDTSAGVEERPIGGLGLLLVHRLTQGLGYERTGGQNRTTFSVGRTPHADRANEVEMDLIEETQGRVVVVIARGRLDGSSSQAFGERLEKLAAKPEPRLLVDFSGIDFVSSAGLRVVLTVLKRVKAANGKLALCSVQGPVREILDITGFTPMLDLHPGRAEAIAALA